MNRIEFVLSLALFFPVFGQCDAPAPGYSQVAPPKRQAKPAPPVAPPPAVAATPPPPAVAAAPQVQIFIIERPAPPPPAPQVYIIQPPAPPAPPPPPPAPVYVYPPAVVEVLPTLPPPPLMPPGLYGVPVPRPYPPPLLPPGYYQPNAAGAPGGLCRSGYGWVPCRGISFDLRDVNQEDFQNASLKVSCAGSGNAQRVLWCPQGYQGLSSFEGTSNASIYCEAKVDGEIKHYQVLCDESVGAVLDL